MTELTYQAERRGVAIKRFVKNITRRGFVASVLGGLSGRGVSSLIGTSSQASAGADFTIAIIPDPQYLAQSCPGGLGEYYAAMMQWIVDNKNIGLAASQSPFDANIKAVVGVGDCVNAAERSDQCRNAQTAWEILDRSGIAFTTPPGNHDYRGMPTSRDRLGSQFATGYFSASNRSSVYGSGIDLGGGDKAYWVGSLDATGANTAVKFLISGCKLLILALDFFCGDAAWSWAYDVMSSNSDCECYITTHAWLTRLGTRFEKTDVYGPEFYRMDDAPYSNSAEEAWSAIGVNIWTNLFGIFGGHDIFSAGDMLAYPRFDRSQNASAGWFWQLTPAKSASSRGQTVYQIFANSQDIDLGCSASVSDATGAGQIASVFLLSRRPALGLLEGRMLSTRSGNWFKSRSATFPEGTSWSTSETLLFSVPFRGLQNE